MQPQVALCNLAFCGQPTITFAAGQTYPFTYQVVKLWLQTSASLVRKVCELLPGSDQGCKHVQLVTL